MFNLGAKDMRNIALAVVVLLAAMAIPQTAQLLAPITGYQLPFGSFQLAHIIGVLGVVVAYWVYDKQV